MKINCIFFIFLFSLCMMSCMTPIDLKTNDSEPVIVIYGCLNEQMAHQTVNISSSSPYFEEKRNQPVSDAVVTIKTSENELFELEELANEKGTYQTTLPMKAVAGITYQLEIKTDFNQDGALEIYGASTTMPYPFELDSIKVEAMSIMGFKHYSLNMYGMEEFGENYYLYRLSVNDTIKRFKLSEYITLSDEGMEDVNVEEGMTLLYIEDRENDRMEDEDYEGLLVGSGDKITLYSSRIEKGYYDFIQQCQQEKGGENPFFGGPASNITTNISNGGVGYFTSFYTSELEGIVPESE